MTLPTAYIEGQTGHLSDHVAIAAALAGRGVNAQGDFGAVGNGIADDTTRLNDAADAAAAAGVPLIVPPGSYKVTDEVVFKGSCYAAGAELVASSALVPALEVRAAAGGGARLADALCVLPDVTLSSQAWAPGALPTVAGGFAALDTGVRLTNLLNCRVFAGHITGFSVGLYAYARGNAGFMSYSDIWLGHHENNKVNVLVGTDNATTDSATAAACNELSFYGGRLSHYSTPTNDVETTGTRQILIDAAASQVNNVTFLRASLEGDTPEFHVDNFGRDVLLLNCRWEVSAATDAKYRRGTRLVSCTDASTVQVDCRNDTIAWGYNSDGVVITNASGASGKTLLTPVSMEFGQLTLTAAAGLNATAGQLAGATFRVGASGTGPTWTTGTNTPEGAVTAPVGSLYSRANGGASTSLYVKESGTGNTGWVAK